MTNEDRMLLFVRDILADRGMTSGEAASLSKEICTALLYHQVVALKESFSVGSVRDSVQL
jgi:hypothetical protein